MLPDDVMYLTLISGDAAYLVSDTSGRKRITFASKPLTFFKNLLAVLNTGRCLSGYRNRMYPGWAY